MKKMNKMLLQVVGALVITITLISCSNTEVKENNNAIDDQKALLNGELVLMNTSLYPNCIDTFPHEELSQGEIDALTLMREEELMAKDVYTYLYPLYNIPVFNNISKSENQHATMVMLLLEKYDLPDPGADHQPGIFVNPELQEMYNNLIELGEQSLIDGLTAGATIEDVDIYDLEDLLENVIDNQDITYVFENLCRGSRNHMRAFYGNLVFRGADYEPQYISEEYFLEIINGSHEPGSGGCGGRINN